MLKSVREREAVIGHVLAQVAAAAPARHPVPHAVVADLFPAELHRRLVATLPHAAHYEPVMSRGRGERRRRFALVRPDLDTLATDEARFWGDLAALFGDARIIAALAAHPAVGAVPRGRPWPSLALERTGPGGRLPLVDPQAPGESGLVLLAVPLVETQAQGPVLFEIARRRALPLYPPHRRRAVPAPDGAGLLLAPVTRAGRSRVTAEAPAGAAAVFLVVRLARRTRLERGRRRAGAAAPVGDDDRKGRGGTDRAGARGG